MWRVFTGKSFRSWQSVRALAESSKSAKGADARRQTDRNIRVAWGGELDTAAVLRVFLKRAADLKRMVNHSAMERVGFNVAPALKASRVRDYHLNLKLRSAKGADARRQTKRNTREALGGKPESATVLRVFLRSDICELSRIGHDQVS
jgi:hypothetical protein